MAQTHPTKTFPFPQEQTPILNPLIQISFSLIFRHVLISSAQIQSLQLFFSKSDSLTYQHEFQLDLFSLQTYLFQFQFSLPLRKKQRCLRSAYFLCFFMYSLFKSTAYKLFFIINSKHSVTSTRIQCCISFLTMTHTQPHFYYFK